MNKDTIDLLPCSLPPADIVEWEALNPQSKLSSDQRKEIDQQLRSNARTFDWIRHRGMPW